MPKARTILVVAAWVLAIASLNACSAGNKTTSETTPSAVPTTVTASNAPSSSVPKEYTKAVLDAALLAGSDLAAGYSADPQMSSGDGVGSSCTAEASALDGYRRDATIKTGIGFTTTTGRAVFQSLTLMSGDVANNTLAALKKAVATCTTWVIDQQTFTMGQADYGSYGDETFSYLVTVKTTAKNGAPFVLATVFMRKGNLLMVVQVSAIGSDAPSDAKAIFDKAANKLSTL